MKVIGIVGSPRKNGNVDTLVQAVLSGAEEAGYQTKKYDLNEMKFQGCQACNYCKSHDGNCRLKDDLAPLLKDIEGAGAIVFGTPIYFYQPSGQFRLMQDRFYSFLKPDFTITLKPGKKAVIVTSQGSPDAAISDGTIKGLDGMLTMYGFKPVTAIKMTGGNDPKAVKQRKELLDQAKAAGKTL